MILVKWVFAALHDKKLNQLKNEIARRFGTELLDSRRATFVKLTTLLKNYEGR
jgi:hypothetical protein